MTTQRALELIEQSGKLLDAGKIEDSISLLEAAADRGVVDPDLSFNRGFAYLKRSESPAATAGDLGQATAGFSESLELRPRDAEATRGLERTQILLRQQNKIEETSLTEGESLIGQVLSEISPLPLALVSGLGAALIVAAVLARFFTKETARTLAAGLVGSALWALGALFTGARAFVIDANHYAVVIAPHADLRDESGRTLRGVPRLTEGTRVRIQDSRGRLNRIASSQGELWVDAAALRRLSRKTSE